MREPLFNTRITKLFGIRHPLLCGGMMWLGDGKYVAAVVNAGGMAFITALAFPDPEEFRRQIHLCRDLTNGKPFGVNLSVSQRPGHREKVEKYINIAIEESVRFVETGGGGIPDFIDRLKTAGCIVIHKVPGLKYVSSAERLGVDALSLIGAEAGGHPGVLLVGTMVQGALLRERTSLPCIVGGGIGTGRQLVAALALGVDGVLMGTRMLASKEIWAHENYKKRIVEGDSHDSLLTMTTFRGSHRVLDNETSRAVLELEKKGVTDFEAYRPHVDGRLAGNAYKTGDVSKGMIDYGQAAAFVKGIDSVETVFDDIIDDARVALDNLGKTAMTLTSKESPCHAN
jgi:NADH:quinone reductase (non-electrogenic)